MYILTKKLSFCFNFDKIYIDLGGIMLNFDVKVLYHSSIRIGEDIFVDPFKIKENAKAKYIFITHSHYDHYSVEDINKLVCKDTIFIAPKDVSLSLKKVYTNTVYEMLPFQVLKFDDINVKSFPSYNVNKNFHKKEYSWLGYLIEYKGICYCVLGDCDANDDNKKLKCDCLLVPIGGTFTMNGKEGAELTNIIKPSLVIPTHYNAIVGDKSNEREFIATLDKSVNYRIEIDYLLFSIN